MYKKNKGEIGGIVFTIGILITLVVVTNNDDGRSFVENMNSKIVAPIQNGIVYLKNKVGSDDSFFADIDELKSENAQLKEANSVLEQSLREFENLKTQNETLTQYLELTEKYSEYSTIPGYIINKDVSNYSKTIVINIGKKDGVEANMAVIADQGLVRIRIVGYR